MSGIQTGEQALWSSIPNYPFLGPGTVPWGTPPLGLSKDDTGLPILTCCVLSRRKLPIHLSICSGTSLTLSFTSHVS